MALAAIGRSRGTRPGRARRWLNPCEAYFFLGHYRLLAGDREGARRAFQDAVATGVKYYVEYASAKLELGRLNAAGGTTARNQR